MLTARSLVGRALEALGTVLGALCCALVALVTLIVMLRYGFARSHAWMAELAQALHAAIFLLGAGWALLRDQHVRVDIYYRSLSPRAQQHIDAVGLLLCLLPLAGVMLWLGWPYVATSFALAERSKESAGLAAIWPIKALLLGGALSLAAGGMAALYRPRSETP